MEEKNNPGKEKATFDWVTQRSSCTLPAIFRELRSQVEQDVNTRNGLRPSYVPYEFSIADQEGGFKVLLKAKDLQMAVAFLLAEHSILIRDDKESPMFDITLAFDDQGQCKLKVNGEDREFWQVRRMALEELMFRSY